MSSIAGNSHAPHTDRVNRRLISGVLLSLLIHACVISLQFGVPAIGLPALEAVPLVIHIANPVAAPEPVAQPAAPAAAEESRPMAKASSGFTIFAPQLPPLPAPVAANSVARRKAPLAPKGIRSPVPPREQAEMSTRVIAQEQNPDAKFAVPVPSPEEAAAPEGGDDAATPVVDELAIAIAKQQEEKALAENRAAAEATTRLAAEEQLRQQQHQDALRLERERQLTIEQETRRQLDEQARQQTVAMQRQAEALAATQAANELALRQKAEVAAREKAEQLALQQKADDERRKAEQLALQQKAEQERLKAEQMAVEQAAESARRRAEQETARQRAQQAAQAAQAAQEREQAARQALAAAAAAPGSPDGAAGGRSPSKGIPNVMFNSDLANRAREQVRGLDILRGAPPLPRPASEEERGRRRIVSGSVERDVPVRLYVESWRQKIERNGSLNYSQLSKDRARNDPVVTVAVRSDGSVEEVTINISSGRTDLDDAVRRIVRVNARYAAFPPNIAARYDVIEIRRVWNFDENLKLIDELH